MLNWHQVRQTTQLEQQNRVSQSLKCTTILPHTLKAIRPSLKLQNNHTTHSSYSHEEAESMLIPINFNYTYSDRSFCEGYAFLRQPPVEPHWMIQGVREKITSQLLTFFFNKKMLLTCSAQPRRTKQAKTWKDTSIAPPVISFISTSFHVHLEVTTFSPICWSTHLQWTYQRRNIDRLCCVETQKGVNITKVLVKSSTNFT